MAQRSNQVVAGLVLIAAGLVFWLLRATEGFAQSAGFLVVGTAFLAAYFARRAYGLLIPGCILAGFGVGLLAGDHHGMFDQPILLGLGGGFIAIWLVAKLYQGRSHWWPLIPGVILILVGLRNGERVLRAVIDNWPLVLVAIGVIVLLGALRPSGRS